MRHIIVMLDNVYEELLNNAPDSDERKSVLDKIDSIQYEIEDIEFFKR